MNTILHYDNGRDNNYNLIRFAAASLVILFHSYHLSGVMWDPLSYLTRHTNLGHFAVSIFFIVSGFLVCKSYVTRRNILVFIEARFLRIFPALIVVIILSVFLIGTIATVKPIKAYLTSMETWNYFIYNSTLIQVHYYLPGVFQDNPYPGAVNGSLWTLPFELWMYIILALFGLLGILNRVNLFNMAMVFCMLLFLLYPKSLLLISSDRYWPILSSYFAAGAFSYLNRRIIPINSLIFVGLMVVAISLHNTSYAQMSFIIAMIYGVFWFAYVPNGLIRRFNQTGDFSYLFIHGCDLFVFYDKVCSTYENYRSRFWFLFVRYAGYK